MNYSQDYSDEAEYMRLLMASIEDEDRAAADAARKAAAAQLQGAERVIDDVMTLSRRRHEEELAKLESLRNVLAAPATDGDMGLALIEVGRLVRVMQITGKADLARRLMTVGALIQAPGEGSAS
ncbi:hypothetical protein GCM10008171_01550 [Methylopila jiangsuensis]|uniref:Uncharacterized protein n=1 Tax=Methylopila jiangsuensis TaxID=586230 RepID=A0A9W6JDA6_9HYPH|nr:hypothetical protein [Methylopila jiangsuensis]MDR6287322.1 nitrogen fixation protein FixH [Methylopila jiangsuensis]GLK74902.1 hypothetical protein GCM10008171_01550 [Methylopila jiangsuensis]